MDATTKLKNREIKITKESTPKVAWSCSKPLKKVGKVPTEILFIINLCPYEYNRMLI